MKMKHLSPLILSGALISCAPLFERPYGTTVHYAAECGQIYCYSAAMLRTVRQVHEGDFIEGAKFGSSAPYLGWTISRIMAEGVELKPSETSPERVIVPYNQQVSVESRPGANYYFGSSLLFEEGPRPGTAVMTILENAR
jgi:hypothetical protein